MAFNGTSAGSKVGLEIWRIENLQPVPIDPATYGSFHTGDCYIVLNTYTKNPRSAKLDADLHFWLGDHSSQDERGAAAYRTVELDDFLNGVPIQHREVQGHESPKFLSYFPNGIQYLDGGVDSAFRHVDSDSYSPRLFHIKGKRNVRCVQVEFSAKSLNEGDCFLLDNGLTIYQWNGAESNRLEKFKALEVGTKIKDKERGGKAKLIFLESRDKNSDSEEFFRLLGGSHADVKSSADGGDDDSIRDDIASLWRVSDSTGKLEMTEVARGKLEKSMLDDNDVFILDGGSEVFVWIGKGASKDERKNAMTYGNEYLLTHNKPSWTPLTRLPSGGETIQFKSKFRQFDVEYIQKEETYVAKERKIEMGVLMEKQKRAEEKMIDQGNGKVTVWKIENLKKVPVEPKLYGQFNSGDSYIVLYQYRLGNRDAYLLYMWQGRDSKTDEKAATALLTVEAAQELGDIQGAQVRVAQNKEPSHFLAIFKSKMVVYSSEGNSSQSNFGSDSRLFHIRGTNAIDTRAVEVAPTATSLNSADCFVLQTKSNAFIWQGSGSNSDERSIAETLTTNILADGRTVVGVMEGNESDEFWSALGGKSDYANAKHLQSQVSEPRLFHVSGLTGNFKVEELFNFAQDDLSQDNVFLLDTVAEVYVWVGANARSADKDAAMSMAMQYVSNAPDGRSSGTPVFKITAGAEPPTFTAQFLGWSFEKAADFSDPYQRKLEQLKAESQTSNTNPSSAAATLKPTGASFSSPSAVAAVAPAPVSPPVSTSSSSSSGVKIYSLAELKSSLPPGVDPTKKQDHLSNQEFESAFGQTRESFAKLAGWRQADLKKKVGIF